MKDNLLIFALALLLWAWLNLHLSRAKKENRVWKETRSGKERRKSRVPVGITFEYMDRRQAGEPLYNGPEQRSGMERRGLFWDRRKPKVSCYCSAKN